MLIGPNWCPWGVWWHDVAAFCASSCRMHSEFSWKVALLLSCKSLLFTKYGGSGSRSLSHSLSPISLFLFCIYSLFSSHSLSAASLILGKERGKRKKRSLFFFDSINTHKKKSTICFGFEELS